MGNGVKNISWNKITFQRWYLNNYQFECHVIDLRVVCSRHKYFNARIITFHHRRSTTNLENLTAHSVYFSFYLFSGLFVVCTSRDSNRWTGSSSRLHDWHHVQTGNACAILIRPYNNIFVSCKRVWIYISRKKNWTIEYN